MGYTRPQRSKATLRPVRENETAVNRLLALAALCMTPIAATADTNAPHLARSLAATCTSCHGTDGRSQPGMAHLAGQPVDELLRKLREFRAGERPATIMHQIAKGYTDEELALVSSYFAAQREGRSQP